MSRRAHARIFTGLTLALIVLHFDAWNDHAIEPLVLGWIPIDLAYHLAWIVLATALVFYMTARVWPEPPRE